MSDEAKELRGRLLDPRLVCQALGIAKGAHRQRGGLLVNCPAHADRTPSCSVRLGDDGTIAVRCFGCDFSGDVLSLIAAVRGLDLATQFERVLEEAAAIAGTHLEPEATRAPDAATALDAASYTALAARLVELCPWTEEPDGVRYMTDRVLVISGSAAGLAVLPPVDQQEILIGKLLKTFEPETMARAGLVWRDKESKKPTLSCFAHPENRLLIPWRGFDGSITVLQRRRIDDQKPQKYVFPSGMKPSLPFGAERLRAHEADRTIVFVEGALDVLALRLLDRRDGLGILPLGLPGLEGWRSDWAVFAKGRAARIGFDADDAAEKKVDAVAADLWQKGATQVQRWKPRGAKDWAELVEHGAPLPAKERAS
jgi:DNA primase